MEKANETQIGGEHYKDTRGECPNCGHTLEHWDIAWAFRFNCFQYIITKWLWRTKGSHTKQLEDLDKIIHAAQKYKEVLAMENNKDCEAGPGYVDQ